MSETCGLLAVHPAHIWYAGDEDLLRRECRGRSAREVDAAREAVGRTIAALSIGMTDE